MSRGRGEPSAWVVRFSPLIAAGGNVLDVACGSGRHTKWLLEQGHRVTAIDADVSGMSDLREHDRLNVVEFDLEGPVPLPLGEASFDAVVVTNYLHRPLLAVLVSLVAPGGLFVYQTFAAGNERFGRPANPDFLLRSGELLDAVRPALRVIAYEDVEVTEPRRALVQRIAAVRP
jgi:SAM-dependent methyltransferase